MLAMQVLGGIYGKRIPLPVLARFWGVDVSTACRRIQLFSAPDGRWTDERRQQMSDRQRRRAEAAGKKLTGKTMRSVRRVHRFLSKNAGYGEAQQYDFDMPAALKQTWDSSVEEGQKMPSPTSNVELMAQAFGADWFDAGMEGVNNYKWLPGYVTELPHVNECICRSGQLCLLPGCACPKCDGSGAIPERYEDGRKVPLADYGKNLFAYLWLKGLEQYGSVQISLEEIAHDTGTDENTVAKYRDELELLQVVRVISGDILRLCVPCNQEFLCTKPKDKWLGECPKCKSRYGKVIKRWADKWIYIADNVMDEETALREFERFHALRDKLKIQRAEFDRAEAIHTLVLKEWRGREHSIKAFFNYMRRRLASEGLERSGIDALFPLYRE